MGPWSWPVLLLSGLAVGALVVGLLVLPRRWEVAALVGIALAIATGIQGALALWEYARRPDILLAACALAMGAALGGYLLASALLARYRVGLPAITIHAPRGEGVGVVILAPVEPAHYRFQTVAEEFADFAESGLPLPSDALLPLYYAARRDSYRLVGASDAPAAVRRIARRVERLLRDRDSTVGPVSVALADAAPRLVDAVAEMSAEGVATVVVTTVTAGRCHKTDKAFAELDAARPASRGVRIVYARPDWSAGGLPELIVERVRRVTHVPAPACGVVLLTPGRPEAWDRAQPDAAAQETFIAQRVRALLGDAGYDIRRVLTAAVEWSEPDAAGAAADLAELGCPQVVVAPATIPVDGVLTLVDLKHAIARLRRHTEVETTVLPAWGDDPLVAEAIAASVTEALGAGGA